MHQHAPAAGARQAGQDADQRGLARTVRPEQAVHADGNGQADLVQRLHAVRGAGGAVPSETDDRLIAGHVVHGRLDDAGFLHITDRLARFSKRVGILRGGLAALAGILAFPLLVVLVIAALFASVADMPMAQGALKGMGAVSAGLIAAVGLRLVSALKVNVMSVGICIALAAMTFIAIAILRIPLAWVLLDLGTLATAWAYRQIGIIEFAAAKADGGKP